MQHKRLTGFIMRVLHFGVSSLLAETGVNTLVFNIAAMTLPGLSPHSRSQLPAEQACSRPVRNIRLCLLLYETIFFLAYSFKLSFL